MVKQAAKKVVLTDVEGNYIVPVIDPADKGSGGSGLEICDIGMSLYVDETKGLRRYLNGQIVDINTNTQAFLNRLQQITTLHPSLLCTEEEWQTAKTMSAFGQVGKFVFNYSGNEIVSVRIPAIVNVQGLFDLQNLGMTVSAGLPNIVASVITSGANLLSASGAFSVANSAINRDDVLDKKGYRKLEFNASSSNSIYGNSNTVQPEAIQYPYFIQIATGSETENNIINDIELNNPYSLFECKYADHELFNLSWLVSNGSYNGSNAVHPSAYQALLVENNAEVAIGSTVTLPNGVKYTKQGLSVKLSTETYTDYDFVVNPADETFRLPIKPRNLNNTRYLIEAGEQDGISYRIYSDGYCEQWGRTGLIADHGTVDISLLKKYIDTNYNIILGSIYQDDGAYVSAEAVLIGTQAASGFTLVSRGVANGGRYIFWKTCGYLANGQYTPLTDNILLYYYVGETVQNANLIDAGRIGEQLANLTTVAETYQNGTSWYRVYSDGWCEQGGYSTSSNVTITLLKTYANTNYTITLGKAFNTETNTRFPNIVSTTKTTAQFKVTGTFNNTVGTDCYFYWETKGYMA